MFSSMDTNTITIDPRGLNWYCVAPGQRLESSVSGLTKELYVDPCENRWEQETTQLLSDWNSQDWKYKKIQCLKTDCSPELSINEKSLLNAQKISQKVREMANDKHFAKVLITTFSEVSFLLDYENIDYEIAANVEEDKEFPEWKETVVSIRLFKVSQEKTFQIWQMVEDNIQSRINQMNDKTIAEKYENLVLIVNTFE